MYRFVLFLVVSSLLFAFPSSSISSEGRAGSVAERMTVEELVGQLLFVGIPSDVANFNSSSLLEEAVTELKIGGVVVNNYNLSEHGTYAVRAQNVLSMINHIQRLAFSSGARIPVFVGADYEGVRYSSLKYLGYHFPEFLTLASTQQAKSIGEVGKLSGAQLMGLGINCLFGPVLDVDDSLSGDVNSNILTRSLGQYEPLIEEMAACYLSGIKLSGILAFGKHLPDVGRSSGNLHDKIMPEYQGGITLLSKQLAVYSNLRTSLDGIMTSHQYFSSISYKKDRPVTFSKTLVADLIKGNSKIEINTGTVLEGIGFQDKLVITDDLSSMVPILSYMENQSLAFGDIAIEAYEAGHDLLLFSHVEISKTLRRGAGKFSFQELRKVRDKLVDYFKASSDREAELRLRVSKILDYKFKLNKFYNGKEELGCWTKSMPADLDGSLKTMGYVDYDSFVKKILNESMLMVVRQGASWSIKDVPIDQKIVIFAPECSFDQFKRHFGVKKNVDIICMPLNKRKKIHGVSYFAFLSKRIRSELKNRSRVVLIITNKDEAHLADVARFARSNAKKNMLIFLHESPRVLDGVTMQIATVLGTFSQMSQSYFTDILVLEGKVEPKNIAGRLSISLPPLYDVKAQQFEFKSDWKPEAPIFDSYQSKEFFEQLTYEKKRETSLGRLIRNWMITSFSAVMFFALIFKFYLHIKNEQPPLSEWKKIPVSFLFSKKQNLVVLIVLILAILATCWVWTGDCFFLTKKFNEYKGNGTELVFGKEG